MNRNAVATHLLSGLEIALQAKAEKERLIELHDKREGLVPPAPWLKNATLEPSFLSVDRIGGAFVLSPAGGWARDFGPWPYTS